jgi:squalene-hopene/tetraprenyl-beta-curcumene cyclase
MSTHYPAIALVLPCIATLALANEQDASLDERIATPERITESAPPPLPELVILPLPPDRRIATEPIDVPVSAEHWERAHAALDAGLAYLRAQQDADGFWLRDVSVAPTDEPDRPSPVSVAVTALAVKALAQRNDAGAASPAVRKGLAALVEARSAEGAWDGGALTNYVTASVVQALAAVGTLDRAADLRGGVTWLQTNQWDDGEGLRPEQDWYGGAGYGKHGRPDLSNTQMMLDALYDAGLSPSEPAFERAVTFLSRTQNLQATNKSAWAGNDGGFVYTPANGGESMASQAAGEGRYGELLPEGTPRSLRSYGSMTYAGFKSLLYAGLSPDDPRVRAAFDWVRRHWTFEENPGLGGQGLFYYFNTMSRCLRVAQQVHVTDIDGDVHNWREELIVAIVKRQREDGSWVNPADRWLEGEPVLATIYSVLALEEALKPVSRLEPGADE